jgi:DNA-directed RNA polymerase subunit RPC12/RpoP
MSLVICPDCGHEISTNAVACPNCGFRLPKPEPVVVRKVVESETSTRTPYWLIIPAVTVVALLLVIMIVMMRNNDPEARNVNVQLGQTRSTPLTNESRVRTVENDPPSQITVPPSSTTVNPPTQAPPPPEPVQRTDVPGTSTTVPSAPEKGLVRIEARVSTRDGKLQSVRNEKFYLLDKDLEMILTDADLEPIEGNSLTNSFGLAVMAPDRYPEFHRQALEAIKKHIKYSGLTDAAGKAAIKDVKPEMYYLFGITKSRSGFAVWSSPVTINTGENILNLSPASFNEISE